MNERKRRQANTYFWRTYTGAELDYVEEKEGGLYGFEFKWRTRKVKSPKVFLRAYPQGTYEVITQEDYLDFVT